MKDKQWNKLCDRRNKLRAKAENRGKADSMLHRSATYLSAARMLENTVVRRWEYDATDDGVNAIRDWTGIEMQLHVEYMQEVVHHLEHLAAHKGKEAYEMIREIDQAKIEAEELDIQILKLHGKLSDQHLKETNESN